MKKYIIIAIAALLAAACTKVTSISTGEEQAITFKTINYVLNTKAEAYTGGAFGVNAFWTPTDWATDGAANPYFNDNEKVVHGPSYAPGEWGPESEYFWPKTGKITFAAYSPWKATGFPGFDALQKCYVYNGYQIPATADEDLMFADIIADQTQNVPQYQLSGNTDGVPILFRHVLSKIGFLFKTVENPNPNATSTVIIKTVKILNINNSGDYNQNDNAWSNQDGTITYSYNDTDFEIAPADDPASPSVGSLILMPQSLSATTAASEGQQLELAYTIVTVRNGVTYNEDVTAKVDITTTEIPAWGPNQSIVYTITISPVSDTPILFDPAVADWTEVSGTISLDR